MMDVEQARQNMLNNQIRACDVLDDDLLALFKETPRELFVPQAYCDLAFADTYIPIGRGQVMMTPFDEGQLLQALGIKPSDTILEIGTGTGYLTALLAKLGKKVTSVDIFEEFTQAADVKLQQLGLKNIELFTADAAQGLEDKSRFDVVVVTGSLPKLPSAYHKLLKTGGRMFAIVGHSPVMAATLFQRQGGQQLSLTQLYETDLLPLINAVDDSEFIF